MAVHCIEAILLKKDLRFPEMNINYVKRFHNFSASAELVQ